MEASNPGATPSERILADGHAFEAFEWKSVTEEGADWVMEMEITPRVVNSLGALQGGILATLIDSVAGVALLQGDLAGPRHVTSELQISFLAAARVGPCAWWPTSCIEGGKAPWSGWMCGTSGPTTSSWPPGH